MHPNQVENAVMLSSLCMCKALRTHDFEGGRS